MQDNNLLKQQTQEKWADRIDEYRKLYCIKCLLKGIYGEPCHIDLLPVDSKGELCKAYQEIK